MYNSPITLFEPAQTIPEQIAKDTDEYVYKAVLSQNIDVNRDELIKALRYDRDQYDKGYHDAMLEQKNEWISVKDRLPEFKELVLAYVKNKDSKGRFNREGVYVAQLEDKVPKHDPEGKKNFWGIPGYDSEWTVWAWSYFIEPEVTHWRPLPEPPKEE